MFIRQLGAGVAVIALSACALQPSPGTVDASGRVPGLRVAQAAEASGDFQLAERVYANASVAAPNDPAVQLGYADVLMRLNKISQARSVLETHLKTVSDPNLLRGGLGAIYVLEGNAKGAMPEFDAVLAADPNNTRWLIDKAVALDMVGRHGEAQDLYRRALLVDSDDPVAVTDLALSLALSGQKSKAAEMLAAVASRTDVPVRVKDTYEVLRAATGDAAEQGTDNRDNEQMVRLATAISNISPN